MTPLRPFNPRGLDQNLLHMLLNRGQKYGERSIGTPAGGIRPMNPQRQPIPFEGGYRPPMQGQQPGMQLGMDRFAMLRALLGQRGGSGFY